MWRRHLEIRDPIHGYIFISELEKRIIDTHIFQRLRRIKQLGGAYLTYPGAEHTRFGHSLGAMHLAGVVGEHLVNLGLIKEDEIEYLRIAALLHDIGHGPFSHVYEDISMKYLGKDHEDLTYWLITESEIKDILNDYGLDVEEVATLAISKKNSEKMKILDQVISSQYDVDKMDFLVRDSHFTGVQYGLVDIFRIIHSLDVINGKLAVEIPGALYALESFLIARYEMFKAVYYHRSVRSANLMLSEAMNLAREYLGIIGFKTPEEYILFDDGYIITKIRELKQTKEKELKQAYKLIEMYTKRELLKCAYEITVHTKNKFLASILTIERLRREIEREIAKRAEINENEVFIDVPTLPSIPYNPRQLDPMEIIVFENRDSEKIPHKLSEISDIVNVLKGYIDVIRAYTFPEYRKSVEKATREVLGEPPPSTRISF